MLLLPTAGAVFLVLMAPVAARSHGNGPDVWLMLAAWAGVYVYIAVYWVLLWRGVVRWTQWRVLATGVAGPIAMGAGAAFGAGFILLTRGAPVQLAILAGGGVPPIVWTLATALLWCETRNERASRLAAMATDVILCPVCSYNLTGLSESVCPECGSRFTLEQLLATQPHQDAGSLAEVVSDGQSTPSQAAKQPASL